MDDDKANEIISAFIWLLRQEYTEFQADKNMLKQIYQNIIKKMNTIL